MTKDQLQAMTIADAKVELSNRIYEAAGLIEELEYCVASDGTKRIRGNGHHIRQQIAKFAESLLAERWCE